MRLRSGSSIIVSAFLALVAALPACTTVEMTIITPTPPPATPTLLPYPDALDVLLVHEAVTSRVNEARAEQGKHLLEWDEGLQELAEWQAWQVTKGAVSFNELDDWPATQLGEPVIELRACMSDNATTPEGVAQVAVEHWLGEPELREMLLGRWQRIGVGFDWGCPKERGVVLVVLLAGQRDLLEG